MTHTHYQPRIQYPAKLPFKTYVQIKTSCDTKKVGIYKKKFYTEMKKDIDLKFGFHREWENIREFKEFHFHTIDMEHCICLSCIRRFDMCIHCAMITTISEHSYNFSDENF